MEPRPTDEHFRGEITVAARIIDLLSSGLYESPAACLKELVNNSFDADAHRVEVFVKPDANRIIIQDDGEGMDRTEFEHHFKRIAESHKRDNNDATRSGRPKIGKIGIGVIAANELCEKLEIYSTKKGSADLLHVTIDFEEMRKPADQRKRAEGDFLKADYYGEVLKTDRTSHYTHIFLTAIRGEARSILAGLTAAKKGLVPLTLYGKNTASVEKIFLKQKIETWKDFDRYSETILEIALNVPVIYQDHWLPSRLKNKVKDLEQKIKNIGFQVYYDGLELRKPIVFRGSDRAFVKRFSFSGDAVSAEGYFYAQHRSVKPREIHGLLVRIRNAAVGAFDPSFWGFSASEYSLIQRWVSCEIWADDRLEDAMNIDRRTLRVTHPAYVQLRDVIHANLRDIFSEVRTKIYKVSSNRRKVIEARLSFQSILDVARSEELSLDQNTIRKISTAWRAKKRLESRDLLLRKYSVSEMYKLIIEVANETLSLEQRSLFLRRLTERLSSD
jgi:hypothetical protein